MIALNRSHTLCAVLLVLLPATLAAADELRLMVGRFSAGELGEWSRKTFRGETRYQLVTLDDRQVLRADSQGAASGLYREMQVSLTQTPYLNWSWRVAGTLEGVDERTRSGDDYPARIYVIASGGPQFWKTRTLIYVWSSHQAIGSVWKSAYTGNARLLAVRSGNAKTGTWVSEKRDVRADWQRVFGTAIDRIDAVALMTDTDDSGQMATAWYGDIYFSGQ